MKKIRLQYRLNAAIALLIVLLILFWFNYTVYILNPYMLFLSGLLSLLPLYNFPWHKFK